jgi:hypothetical protein
MTIWRRRSRLVALVRRFVEADSWPASLVFLERHAALLTDAADDILTDLCALASARGDGAAAQAFEAHRAALRGYRELGAAAFDELIAAGMPAALRPGWAAAETAYQRYRARPGRATADTAVHAVTAVLRHDSFAAVPAAARAGMHQAGGTLLGERYQRHGGPAADLDDAVSCFTAAVQELPDDAPDRPSYASALGNVLGMRYEERGDPADLDAGIRWSREAAASMPADERWWLLHNLSANLGIRYEMLGDPADLTEALGTAREALASDPPESARSVLASSLSTLLLDRYERDGAIDDLRSSINVARAAGSAGPREERAALMVILATALQRYAERVNSTGELDEAVGLLGHAARLLGKRSPHLPACLSTIGQIHLTRFQQDGVPGDLLAACDAYARALRHADPAAQRTALMRSSKGTIEVALASLGVAGFGFDSAVSDLRAAATAGSSSLQIRAFLLANLAAGYKARYQGTGLPEDQEAGVSAYREACRDALTHDLEVALNAALDWGDWAASRESWSEASVAHDLAFEAADGLWRHQLGRTEKEIWLGAVQRLGEQAGLAAARAGQLHRAAVFMERGRAQLLAESLSLAQLDLYRLAAVNPGLADRYAAAADRLRSLDAAARDERSSNPIPGHAALFGRGRGVP